MDQELESNILLKKRGSFVVFFTAIGISLFAALYLYSQDPYSLLYYGDAVSHLVNARQIFDWEAPGLIQLGTVWLPLPHLMLSPFSLIDPLFVSGFAGLVISLPCHAITCVLIYKIIRNHTSMQYLPIIGGLLYATNPNMIYLAITAMTEAPFILFFVASMYYLDKWNKESTSTHLSENSNSVLVRKINFNSLILSSIFLSLSTLCRYEGWLLVLFFVPYLFWVLSPKIKLKHAKKLIAFIFLILVSGIIFWLGWNQYLYANPLEFVNSEFYSASSQSLDRPYRDFLFLQPLNVLLIYGQTTFMIFGPILLSLAVVGFFLQIKKKEIKKYASLYVFFALPPLFTITTLFFGIAEMSQWWFNARYVVFLAPLVILFVTFFVAYMKERKNSKVLTFVLVFSIFVFQSTSPLFGVVTFLDAKSGFEYKQSPFIIETAQFLRSEYDDGRIMMMTGSAQAHRIMLYSEIQLVQFDDIIEPQMSKPSFKNPWLYDKWIIMGKEPDSDSVSAVNYWEEESKQLSQYYEVAFENQYYKIMSLK